MGWAMGHRLLLCQFLALNHSGFWQNCHIIFHTLVMLKLLVLLKAAVVR